MAVRVLAYVPGFLRLLRSGHVSVSFFGSYYTLREYAAQKLMAPNFRWSSLPVEFHSDLPAREAAAAYLSGEQSEGVLPRRYREMLIRFKEEITLLDENLPSRWKAGHYQYQKTLVPGKPSTLADYLDLYYIHRQDQLFFQSMVPSALSLAASRSEPGHEEEADTQHL